MERDVNPFDPTLAIQWPIARDQLVVSAKDEAAPLLDSPEVQASLQRNHRRIQRKCTVLLLGRWLVGPSGGDLGHSSGYFGSHFEKHLQGVDYVLAPVRLQQRESIAQWLDACQPEAVICAAGTAGESRWLVGADGWVRQAQHLLVPGQSGRDARPERDLPAGFGRAVPGAGDPLHAGASVCGCLRSRGRCSQGCSTTPS